MSQRIPKAYMITQGAHKPSLLQVQYKISPGKHELKVGQYLFEQAKELMISTERVMKYLYSLENHPRILS
jgi:hypothetical protein